MPNYSAFGLHFSLPFECSRLSQIGEHEKIDLDIYFNGKNCHAASSTFEAYDVQDVFFTIHSVASFHIQNGNTISIALAPNVDLDTLMLFLFGSVFGVILYQRGYFVLHGCTIEHRGVAHCFVGPSGVGKSTLATSFMLQGYHIISDDVCAIKLINQQPYVFPGFPDVKLWKSALDQYDIACHSLRSVRPNEEKYYIPLTNWKNTSIPLYSVTQLNRGKSFELLAAKSFEKYKVLLNNLYRPEFLPKMNINESLFKFISFMLPFLKIQHITRPNTGFQLTELSHFIKNEIFEVN